jgi:hypothetical protein
MQLETHTVPIDVRGRCREGRRVGDRAVDATAALEPPTLDSQNRPR